jgi:hypothetical protein
VAGPPEASAQRYLRLNGWIGDFGLNIAGRQVFLYRAAMPASAEDRKSNAGYGHVAEWLRSGLQIRIVHPPDQRAF